MPRKAERQLAGGKDHVQAYRLRPGSEDIQKGTGDKRMDCRVGWFLCDAMFTVLSMVPVLLSSIYLAVAIKLKSRTRRSQ